MKTTATRSLKFIEFFNTLLLWTALAAALAGAVEFGARILGSLNYRYPFEYGETVMVLPLLRMAEVPWIYGDITRMPHHLMPYHPIYIYITHLIDLATHLSHSSVYAAGRTVTGVAALTSSGWIFLILRRRVGARQPAAATAALLFLSSPFLTGEAIHVKPDLTALAFALGGLYFGIADKARGRTVLIASAFFAMAFMTKQNYLFAAAAAVLWRLLRGEWKEAAATGTLSAALALCGVGVLVWGSNGHYSQHAFLNVNSFYAWKIFWINWDKIVPQIGSILMCGVVSACVLLRKFRRPSGALGLYYFISASILLFLGKGGWGENHAIEPLAAACLALGAIIGGARIVSKGGGFAWAAAGRLAVTAVIVGQLFLYLPGRSCVPAEVSTILAKTEAQMDEFIPLLRSVKGPILAENPGILIAAGLPVWYQPYEFAQMSYAGKFDQKIILNELRQKKYALIVTQTNFFTVKGTGRFTPEFIRTLGENYRFAGTKHGQYFYLPS